MEVVVEGAAGTVAGIVGREPELEVLRGFFGGDGSGRALVLSGEAGIGKTTLWEAGVELARERGLRTLIARPSGTEARLSFAALIDVFEDVDARALVGLPGPQRSALEVALLRAEPSGAPPEPHAIALGFLNALRALAAERPVLLAVDDIPWLDAPSADALVFAARRLKDEPVTFLLARRPGRRSALEQALEPRGLERLEVGPLGFGASRRLLSERLGLVRAPADPAPHRRLDVGESAVRPGGRTRPARTGSRWVPRGHPRAGCGRGHARHPRCGVGARAASAAARGRAERGSESR